MRLGFTDGRPGIMQCTALDYPYPTILGILDLEIVCGMLQESPF